MRQFAGACLVFFPAIGLHQYFVRNHHTAGLVLIGFGLVVGTIGLIWPVAVRWFFVAWMIAAFPIGWVLSQVMLFLMFFGIITPVALLFRLQGRDLLRRKPAPAETTFWSVKETPHDVRRYFSQY